MSKEFDEFVSKHPEISPALISKQDVSILKIKLKKGHRTVSDWTTIKRILTSHDLITIRLQHPRLKLSAVHGVLCEDNYLITFTNIDDCEKYVRYLRDNYSIEEHVGIASLPFEAVIGISDDSMIPAMMDLAWEPNQMCYGYDPKQKQLKAILLAK